ncbi:MAG: alkaline phosphatase family protein [Mesorhizobium sp.]|uniref:alkaline phosphatase family protein n=1 Tax=Mesorhizobium sp. TaxID=1871066 RepID=UPI000FE5BB35|nr:alkaline phosphatase family protein [Mesorhizobium sp.]RWI63649.1 MAG: alkaline phosphatase family protein [Mesorhizobium sp.]RWJ42706.1 MAG: alkaline phosphatase family protein [Mesorhizobium sp.]RWJ58111.1 MAG: alkaline phosphatase family protein [Mesorhizobium sp.]RWJ63985.1 MAG: alkaline phosphatase family protein [Mesorhizobium sp.]RWJ93861.1 MAG: alkaline phosphatase family protein [Mesorhizobium sp.]
MTQQKLLLIMIDGVSADYFENHRGRLPNLSSLADDGYIVRRMRSAVPGTSMPGRASILTGVEADVHGVFGNRVLSDGAFIAAEVEHLHVPTIATLASRAGLDVACIGHALIDPEDTSVYMPPSWMRGPGFTKVPSDGSAPYLLRVKDPRGRLAGVPLPSFVQQSAEPDNVSRVITTLIDDQLTISAAAGLIGSQEPPDLVVTEINVTDMFQHEFGYESEEAHFAAAFADALVGLCLDALRRSGRLDDYVIAIASDHGHGNIDTSILPELVIPGKTWSTEGATLHVLVDNDADRADVTQRLTAVGAEPWNDAHLPVALRERIATFVAPPQHDFEDVPAGHSADQVFARPKYKSTHGFRPGLPADDRMCIFSGAGVPKGSEEVVDPTRLTPTLAAILGLPLDLFPDRPLF